MDKLVLSLIFSSFFVFGAHAEPDSETNILPISFRVEIQSRNAKEWIESPEVTIFNSTDHCEVHANELGHAEWLAVKPVASSEKDMRVVQVVSAVFGSCRIYFGRIKDLQEGAINPPSILLGQASAEKLQVTYEGVGLEEQMMLLSEKLRANASRLSPATAMVLLNR